MSQRRSVLVTGATGTVGRQVVAQLLAAGIEVRALVRNPGTAGLPSGVAVKRGDLREPDSLRAALTGVTAVFLVWPFATAEGMAAVLDVAVERARRVVYLSSAAQRDHERQGERLIEQSGLEWTFLRPHVFAAHTLRWADQIRASAVVREPNGAAAMAVVHERDIAAVAVRALADEGHRSAAYELTGPEPLTQAAQARIIGEVIGRPVRWEEASPDAAKGQLLSRGWPAAVVDEILQAQAEMVAKPKPATSTVREVTGMPARPFRAWVADHARAFRSTMTAARIHEHGDASVIRCDEIPVPAPGPGEVLLRVAATSFNPAETALRSGALRTVLPAALPYTLGWDVAGTIVQTGAEVQGFAAGDRVIGRLDTGGAAAEYVAAPASALARAPADVPLPDAAAIPVAGLTAWQALYERARIASGQRVLINGAGGGVGAVAVQLAKRVGATVIATASSRSAAAVRRHGADQIIDYTATPLADALDAPVDAIVNLAAITATAATGLATLVRPGGVIVSIATPVQPPTDAKATATHLVARNDAAQLAEIVALVDADELVVDIAESHPLSDLASIHQRSEAGETHGKIIILP